MEEVTHTSYPPTITVTKDTAISVVSSGNYNTKHMFAKAATPNPDAKELTLLTVSLLAGEAGQASLSALTSIWRARWGSNWVRRSEIEGEFYEVAAARLHASARLESHVLADGAQVFRLDDE